MHIYFNISYKVTASNFVYLKKLFINGLFTLLDRRKKMLMQFFSLFFFLAHHLLSGSL